MVTRTPLTKARLARLLEEAPGFPSPKRSLEQYPTPGDIAADLVLKAFFMGDIESRRVADLGSGTGRLGYAALLLGASEVVMVDLDAEALEASRRFLRGKGVLGRAEHVAANATSPPLRRVDTVVQNPPFGTARRGIDSEFLRAAMGIADAVYSLHAHNPAYRDLLCRLARRMGFTCRVVATYRFPIRAMYREHYKRIHYVFVDAYVFRRVDGVGSEQG